MSCFGTEVGTGRYLNTEKYEKCHLHHNLNCVKLKYIEEFNHSAGFGDIELKQTLILSCFLCCWLGKMHF